MKQDAASMLFAGSLGSGEYEYICYESKQCRRISRGAEVLYVNIANCTQGRIQGEGANGVLPSPPPGKRKGKRGNIGRKWAN